MPLTCAGFICQSKKACASLHKDLVDVQHKAIVSKATQSRNLYWAGMHTFG